MNILYFTLDDFESLMNYHSINTDLLREFQKYGHKVHVITPSEKRKGLPTKIFQENGAVILKPQIGNIQKTNIIEKGISTFTIGNILIRAIKKYLGNVKFDLILYCTPPITFLSAIEYVKKRDNARTYLLLKDIFPQNAVDLEMMSTYGVRGLLYRHFRAQEKKLYEVSDHIGCMSTANVQYVLNHNPEVKKRDDKARQEGKEIVEVCPNAIEVVDKSVNEEARSKIRKKYGIPLDKTVFVYGGNLGKPQGIPFIIECMKKCENVYDVFFLIVGDGAEYSMLEEYVMTKQPANVKLMRHLPKEDYDAMVGACDVGLIFLDHRFTIPNFPSRMLSYMQAKLPVLACTDPHTDIGKVITEGRFGWWCESNNQNGFVENVKRVLETDLCLFGDNAFDYLKYNYDVEDSIKIVLQHGNSYEYEK